MCASGGPAYYHEELRELLRLLQYVPDTIPISTTHAGTLPWQPSNSSEDDNSHLQKKSWPFSATLSLRTEALTFYLLDESMTAEMQPVSRLKEPGSAAQPWAENHTKTISIHAHQSLDSPNASMFAHNFNRLHLWVLPVLFVGAGHSISLPACPDPSASDVDFVVVGAGAGGGPVAAGLAESGYSVLVVDAGHDINNINTTIPFYFGRAVEDPQSELNYTFDEYSPGAKFPRNDGWYPRARALGGSTIHNALVNNIAATERDFDDIATLFNDSTWSYKSMRTYFKRLEHNLHLNESDPDHGFAGWLKTSLSPTSILREPQIRSEANDAAIGVVAPSYTMDEQHTRSSVRERLIAVQSSSGGKLRFSFDTLATKVLMCDPGKGAPPKAYGVEISPGAALAVASNFHGKSALKTKIITARHEVVVSAGVFQSPQLLSGIGDEQQLRQHGIMPIVHLPGVGKNLQDHDEVANIWTLKQNHTIFNGCTILYTPEDDPCLKFWTESGHQNLVPGLFEPDMMIYWVPGYFPGFVHGFPDQLAQNHNVLTAIILKAHPTSQGVLPGGQEDINTIVESIKTARELVSRAGIVEHIEAQVFPGPEVQSDDEIKDHVLEHVFGHHACCTNAIGADGDPDAVLDGDFKVRGVENLRVVDLSSWPKVPGWFVTTPTYMMAEKAADVIIAAAKQRNLQCSVPTLDSTVFKFFEMF
ncbi:hypothetical protein C8J57DRAFT_1237287 [Mycena rebaudengoi]|nr:hypothetical protein C8J57DRAFT_1237287 [Mycena rebaudengoi]